MKGLASKVMKNRNQRLLGTEKGRAQLVAEGRGAVIKSRYESQVAYARNMFNNAPPRMIDQIRDQYNTIAQRLKKMYGVE